LLAFLDYAPDTFKNTVFVRSLSGGEGWGHLPWAPVARGSEEERCRTPPLQAGFPSHYRSKPARPTSATTKQLGQ